MDYKPFSNAVVAFKEPTVSEIVPKSGPRAGKQTFVVEFKAYRPNFEKKADGSFERKKESTFYTVQYFGSEKSAKAIAQNIQPGMTLEVRGDIAEKTYQSKDGQSRTENIISAKGIALSLNQPGISIHYERPKSKINEQER